MRVFTIFGFETFFLLLPFLIWSGKHNFQVIGVNLSFIMHFNLLLITAFKLIFLEERPVWINESIREYQGHQDFSFPSGHAWGTTIAWLYISFNFKSIGVRLFSVVIILMTSFSRVYFGVHYPHDVVAGIALGMIFFILKDYILLINIGEISETRIRLNRRNRKFLFQVASWIVISLLVLFMVEETHRRQHVGFPYSIGALAASMFLVPTIVLLEDVPSSRRTGMRTLFGLAPVLVLIYATYHLHLLKFAWIDEVVMLVGALHSIWLYAGAAIVFERIGLGTKRVKSQ